MKTAWLLLYLWHQSEAYQYSSGGPSLAVAAMPSLQVCEVVGAAAKQFADSQPQPRDRGDFIPKPATSRCVEVDSSNPRPLDETAARLRREIADREAELARLRGGQ